MKTWTTYYDTEAITWERVNGVAIAVKVERDRSAGLSTRAVDNRVRPNSESIADSLPRKRTQNKRPRNIGAATPSLGLADRKEATD